MWKIIVTSAYRRSVEQLSPEAAVKINRFFEKYRDGVSNPFDWSNLKKIAVHPGYGRLRFGKYRVGIFFDEEHRQIILTYAGKRGDFYKHFPH
ncbi:MAG: hypothetical protein HQK57_04215 [Deltaproteobacteria bacterium]|nr:hypothetical protein [Deltaproteobacteria bacterium]MBF0526434.1 hypothetical protein [Deltaproteobacteria bacterium]